jgi:hypothetical protein
VLLTGSKRVQPRRIIVYSTMFLPFLMLFHQCHLHISNRLASEKELDATTLQKHYRDQEGPQYFVLASVWEGIIVKKRKTQRSDF